MYILFQPIKQEFNFSDLQLGLHGATAFTIFYTLLLARAVVGTLREWPATARALGFGEIAFGALTVLAVAAGQ